MENQDNQRLYQRGSHWGGRAKVSANGENWQNAEVADVSSGGLKFFSGVEYAEGDVLWFDLVLEGFLSEIAVKARGEVRRKIPYGGRFQYGIRFKDLSPEKKIQIDENIRNDRPVAGGTYEAD